MRWIGVITMNAATSTAKAIASMMTTKKMTLRLLSSVIAMETEARRILGRLGVAPEGSSGLCEEASLVIEP